MIIDSFSKTGNGQVVENLFPEKMIHDLSESHLFLNLVKNDIKRIT